MLRIPYSHMPPKIKIKTPFSHSLYTTNYSNYSVTLLKSNMYMYIYLISKYWMYIANKHYTWMCIHTLQLYIYVMFMCNTLVCKYVKVQ